MAEAEAKKQGGEPEAPALQPDRSDCRVRITPGGEGLRIAVTSKVASMYGEAILAQAREVLGTLGVADAEVEIADAGALPYCISARIELAARRAGLEIASPALPERSRPYRPSPRERLRRSRLYLPGNSPKLAVNAALHGPDGIILDLEDSVAPAEKLAACLLVRNALRALDFGDAEVMVRINQLPAGLGDLEWIAAHGVHVILVPKVEDAETVRAVDARIAELEPPGPVWLMPIIESARGCFAAFEIASASPNVIALAIGLEDYTADIGAQRTLEGRESFWARSMLVNAARAAGVTPIDTVFSDVGDMEGLREAVAEARSLGFEGKGCIHPRQIPVVHAGFAPSGAEIARAGRIALAFEDAEARGLGVVSLGTKMIDPPVVKRALKTIALAVAIGALPEAWREDAETHLERVAAAERGGEV